MAGSRKAAALCRGRFVRIAALCKTERRKRGVVYGAATCHMLFTAACAATDYQRYKDCS